MIIYDITIPGGSNTYFQYNKGGIFGGSAHAIINDATGVSTFTGVTVTGNSVLGLNSAVFKPTADTVDFWRLNDKDGNVIESFDTVNNRVGFFTTTPTSHVSFGNTLTDITTDSTDGSDNKGFRFSGGGAYGTGRGASFQFFGNEYPTFGGQMYFDSGGIAGASIFFRSGPTTIIEIQYLEDVLFEYPILMGTSKGIGFEDSVGTDMGNMLEFFADDLYITARKVGAHMIFRANGTTEFARLLNTGNLGVGATGMVSLFEVDGPQGLAIETVTGDTTLDNTHSTLLVNASGNVTVTLPTAASAYNGTDGIGRIYEIKKIDADANTVTIDGNGSETIDGGTTAVLIAQYESITIQSDGSNWHII